MMLLDQFSFSGGVVMYHHPRRPYYSYRSEYTPAESSLSASVEVSEPNRFMQLVRQITQRQQDAKTSRDNRKASAS
jgi:hypothetical protein